MAAGGSRELLERSRPARRRPRAAWPARANSSRSTGGSRCRSERSVRRTAGAGGPRTSSRASGTARSRSACPPTRWTDVRVVRPPPPPALDRCSASVRRVADVCLERGSLLRRQIGQERRRQPPSSCARRRPPPAIGEQLVAIVRPRRSGPRLDEPLPVSLERVGLARLAVCLGIVRGPLSPPPCLAHFRSSTRNLPMPLAIRVSPYQFAEDTNRCCFARVSAT